MEGVGKTEDELEIGDETLDFASVDVLGSNFMDSVVVEAASCLGGA